MEMDFVSEIRITLFLHGQQIGYIDYDLINLPERMGNILRMFVAPRQLLDILTRKIKHNKDVNVRGGFMPEDLSQYFDGLVHLLSNMQDEIEGFDFQIPPNQNPFSVEPTEEVKTEVH